MAELAPQPEHATHHRTAALVAMLGLVAAVAAAPWAIRTLDAIPVTAAAFDHYRRTFMPAIIGCFVALALATIFGMLGAPGPARRAHRITVAVMVAGTLLCFTPILLGLGQLAAEVLLYVAAAFHLLALLRVAADALRPAPSLACSRWTAPVCLLCAGLSCGLALLSAKFGALGWAKAMD